MYQPRAFQEARAELIDRLLAECPLAKLAAAVVGVEIRIERIEARFKLGQNKPVPVRISIVEGLRRRGGSSDPLRAAWMLATAIPSGEGRSA